jgi:hypothetical protein
MLKDFMQLEAMLLPHLIEAIADKAFALCALLVLAVPHSPSSK